MGFPAAIREKPRCWVDLSCAGHLVSIGLGEIKQPCPRALHVRGLVRRCFNLAFLRGKDQTTNEVKIAFIIAQKEIM